MIPNRPHDSLEFEHLDSPETALGRKMRTEMYFAIGHRLFGLERKYELFKRNEIEADTKYFQDSTAKDRKNCLDMPKQWGDQLLS